MNSLDQIVARLDERPRAGVVADMGRQLDDIRGEARAAREAVVPLLDVLIVACQGWRQEIRDADALRERVAELERSPGRRQESEWAAG